ncbi:glycosyltransferase family 4 protein [Polynucleobacter kasalickyi]|uniref:Glycosyltransferase involved in cell wall bisynthesis n=1 Tax=Polynucleobacter kasalickyi TaxID=1938817 RepID=A0A1W1ZW11_9BURK|nr:glycosyltransferase family 1 protein [Polynucleobacter kasalickyi]SMC52655.1 Glycosyltransferase involved in cell wall bisynthesis [Polynucleobacter kasalickyi]
MKILIITDAWEPQINGVVRTLKQTKRELEEMGHVVDILSPLEFKTIPCPTYPDISLSIFPGRKIARRIKLFKPDALHISTEGPLGLAARSYAVRNKLPFSTAYHTRFPEYVKARTGIPVAVTYKFLKWFHRKSLAVMAPTPTVKKDLESYGFTNVVLWSRGVDLSRFEVKTSDKLSGTRPIFLNVGRVAVEKNIEAFLALDLPGSKVVIGDGPSLPYLKEKYPMVQFLGAKEQSQLPEYYCSADVFVFPSKTDTFGLVLLEAMACGLPVAAYPVTGPIDVIGQSESGALRENLEEACLAALKISKAEARKYAEGFSWQAATEQFVKHLQPVPPGLVEASSDFPL